MGAKQKRWQAADENEKKNADAVHQLGLEIVENVSSIYDVSAESAAAPSRNLVSTFQQEFLSDCEEDISSDVQFLTWD